MSILSSVPFIGKMFDRTIDVVQEAVTDKDAQNRILGSLETLKQQIDKELHIIELQTKTVPWVDALHKMGRQMINLVTIIAVTVLLLKDIAITGPAALILGSGNVAYQVIKGKGRQ